MKRLAKKLAELGMCFSLVAVSGFAQRGAGGGARGGGFGGGFGHGGGSFHGGVRGGGFGHGGFSHGGFARGGTFFFGQRNFGFHNNFNRFGFGFHNNFNRFGFGLGLGFPAIYGGYYGGYYPYAYPYYDYGLGYGSYGYSPSPSVVVVAPYAAESTPPVVVNQEFVKPANPVMHEYSWGANGKSQQTIYLIAFKNETIRPAVAYWTEGGTLHWVDLKGAQREAKLDTVDRPLSEQLNRDRHVPFSLPPGPAVNH
ncbi:MAG: hypothetical protein M1541_10470 [Acidobacteria bacterium]|nr:hypothetical protein [Acidobacteriota bacterium]